MNKIIMIISSIMRSLYERIRRGGVKLSLLSVLDNECKFENYIKVNRFCVIRDTKIGRFSYIGSKSHIINCRIGNFCSISSNVNINPGKHPSSVFSTSPIFYSNNNPFGLKIVKAEKWFDEFDEVVIGNDVWIGMNVIIMGGVTIGDGAIIGAGSIVTKNIEPYTVVAGVPAKVLRKRFNNDIIEKLLYIKWWNLDIKELEEYYDGYNDINSFIATYDRRCK